MSSGRIRLEGVGPPARRNAHRQHTVRLVADAHRRQRSAPAHVIAMKVRVASRARSVKRAPLLVTSLIMSRKLPDDDPHNATFIACARRCSWSSPCSTSPSICGSTPNAAASVAAFDLASIATTSRAGARGSSRRCQPARSLSVLFVGVPCGRNARPRAAAMRLEQRRQRGRRVLGLQAATNAVHDEPVHARAGHGERHGDGHADAFRLRVVGKPFRARGHLHALHAAQLSEIGREHADRNFGKHRLARRRGALFPWTTIAEKASGRSRATAGFFARGVTSGNSGVATVARSARLVGVSARATHGARSRPICVSSARHASAASASLARHAAVQYATPATRSSSLTPRSSASMCTSSG